MRQGWEILKAMWPPEDKNEVCALRVKTESKSEAKSTKNFATKANQVLRQTPIGFTVSKKEGGETPVWRQVC